MENNLYSYVSSMFNNGNIPSEKELSEIFNQVYDGKTNEEIRQINMDFYKDGYLRELLEGPTHTLLNLIAVRFMSMCKSDGINICGFLFDVVHVAYLFGSIYSYYLTDENGHFAIDTLEKVFKNDILLSNFWRQLTTDYVLLEHVETFIKARYGGMIYPTDELRECIMILGIMSIKVASEHRTKIELLDLYFHFFEKKLDWKKMIGLTGKEYRKYSKPRPVTLPNWARTYQEKANKDFNFYFERKKYTKAMRHNRCVDLRLNSKHPDSMEKAAEIIKVLNTYCKYEDFKTDDESLENYSYEELYAFDKASGYEISSVRHIEYIVHLVITIIYNMLVTGKKDCHYFATHKRLAECISYGVFPNYKNYIDTMHLCSDIDWFSKNFKYPKDIKRAYRYRINKIKARRDKTGETNEG